MSDANVNTGPSNLLEGLSKLGSSIVGLSAFAYIAGFVKLKSMYTAVDAAWIVDFLTTQDVVKAGLEPLAMVGVTAVATCYILVSRSWVAVKLLSFFVLLLFLICSIYVPTGGFEQGWFESFKFSKFIAYFLYMVSGFLVSYSVFKVFMDRKLYKRATAAFMVGMLCSLYLTPVYLGEVWASSVVGGEVKLPRALGEQYKSEMCYLLGNVNSKYLIGCIVLKKMARVQLVDVGGGIAFE